MTGPRPADGPDPLPDEGPGEPSSPASPTVPSTSPAAPTEAPAETVPLGAGEPSGAEPAGAPAAPTAGAPAPSGLQVPRWLAPLRPVVRLLQRLPHPPWNTWRGVLLLVFVLAGGGAVVGVAGMRTVTFSESASFCTTCHTMEPQKKAYAASPHSDVACGECHVDPGVAGFVKAKIGGTKELYMLLTNTYPTPIPAPDHTELPPVQNTCLKCHPIDQITKDGGPTKLIVRPVYDSDEANTRQTISVLLRPVDLSATTSNATGERGVHWHVQEKVTYTSEDVNDQKIDLVQSTLPDGETQTYVASSAVHDITNVVADITRLRGTENNRVMDCYACHNLVGHETPSVDEALDDAMAAGTISPSLPYIKRDGLAVLSANYKTVADATTAIEAIATNYAAKYPVVARQEGAQITQAVSQLKQIYTLVATPRMNAPAGTYANDLGHQGSPGCFRCHDGAHYLVADGKMTNQVIPSTCDTCHTFPQSNASPANIPIGIRPANHDDALWAFDHAKATSSTDPDPATCGACHAKSYCENCHDSGAIKVDHTTMLYNHEAAITAAGGTNACAYCHQTAYCQQCHKTPVLGTSAAQLGQQAGSGT